MSVVICIGVTYLILPISILERAQRPIEIFCSKHSVSRLVFSCEVSFKIAFSIGSGSDLVLNTFHPPEKRTCGCHGF